MRHDGNISDMRYGLPVPNSVNESDHLSQIGSLIRDARKHRGWTQNELAAHLGTSQSAINRIERGGQNVTLDNLARISEALRTPLMRFGPANPHLRVTGPTEIAGKHRGQDLQECWSGPVVRVFTESGQDHPAPGGPHRRGQQALGSSRVNWGGDPLAQRRQRPLDRATQRARPVSD